MAVREVLFVVGEASGDLHAAQVAEGIAAARPDLRLVGIGGVHMRRAGVEILEPVENLAVMGFVGVLRHLPKHRRLLNMLTQRIARGNVALVIVLDYPGFNMQVAKVARAAGIPVLYYITPQVWAWGANRLPRLAKLITKAACILSFEEPLLRAHGIDATFVGHPLLDRAHDLPSMASARASLGIAPEVPLLALFPGSRRAELARHLAPFVETARELVRRIPELEVIVSVAPTVSISDADCPFPRVTGESFTVLRAATAGLLKSGTTTLEAAVADLPHVVGYRTSALEYAIARRVVRIPHIGLVNIVAQREVSREFVQQALAPTLVANTLQPLLDSGSAAHHIAQRELAEVRARLGTPGAARRVTAMALGMLA